jgi:amidase
VISGADSWIEYATPLSGTALVGGPQVTVIGSPAPFPGAITFVGNWLAETFSTPLSYTGHDRNFQGYVHTITLKPGVSQSLLHFVVLGKRVNTATSAAERASVEATASLLSTAPPVSDLSLPAICSIVNFDLAHVAIDGFNPATCSSKKLAAVTQPPVRRARRARPRSSTTSSRRPLASCRPTWKRA